MSLSHGISSTNDDAIINQMDNNNYYYDNRCLFINWRNWHSYYYWCNNIRNATFAHEITHLTSTNRNVALRGSINRMQTKNGTETFADKIKWNEGVLEHTDSLHFWVIIPSYLYIFKHVLLTKNFCPTARVFRVINSDKVIKSHKG